MAMQALSSLFFSFLLLVKNKIDGSVRFLATLVPLTRVLKSSVSLDLSRRTSNVLRAEKWLSGIHDLHLNYVHHPIFSLSMINGNPSSGRKIY